MSEGRDGRTMSDVPQARLSIRSEDLGSELLLYDENERQYHLLNSTARLVWQFCDGRHDSDQIAELVAEHYPTADAAPAAREEG